VSSGGTVLFEEDINSSDSNAIAHEMKVVVKTASKPLLEDQIAFKTFAENNRIINFDVSELVKENGFLVGWFQNLASVSLFLAIFICVIEILLGMALLIGWAPKLTVWLLLLMIIFFTFLTWYSWHYDKVTDCGCFGDAIKLTPKQSFYKDLFLSIAILILFIWRNNIRPVFSNSFSVRILSVSMVLFTGFSLYCWHYLPLKNFLKFKEGADILKLSTLDSNAKQEIREFTYIYQNASGDKLELPLNQVNKEDLKAKGYTYLDRIDKIIQEGDAPEIHDFKIMDENANSHLDAFYGAHRWKIMIVMNQLSTADLKAISELKKIIDIWTESGYPVYPLTASSAVEVEQFRHEHQLGVDFYYGDDTNLKSIIRSNPGLLLFDGSVVVKTWPATRLPEPEDLIALTR
jgi:uncharacterized membrane protein YphA (DoxX/SURF4 family)